jgi:hypothetical protein
MPRFLAAALDAYAIDSLSLATGIHFVMNVVTHRLSCVQASAPPEAVIVAKAAMIMAYESRFRGITYSKIDVAAYGGSPGSFPREQGIHAMADASWGARNRRLLPHLLSHGRDVARVERGAGLRRRRVRGGGPRPRPPTLQPTSSTE